MPDDFTALTLPEYAAQLEDPTERARVFQALEDAKIPIDVEVVDDIESRFGSPDGSIDIDRYLQVELKRKKAQSEFEALMQAARLVRVLLAFRSVNTPEGRRYLRVDRMM